MIKSFLASIIAGAVIALAVPVSAADLPLVANAVPMDAVGAPDLFGGGHAYAAPFAQASTTSMDSQNVTYGAGLKFGYDLTRNFALEGYALKTGADNEAIFKNGHAVTQAGLEGKLRQPFTGHLAVTESAGVGCDIQGEKLLAAARVGLELKATARLGAFADAGIETDTYSFTRVAFRGGASFTF